MNTNRFDRNATDEFHRLLELIRTLRSDHGCPWDKKQTPRSFHPYILEEYHELIHALSDGDADEIADEMGDLLFLTVFTAYMLEQEEIVPLTRVLSGVIEKMTRRHPHVFGTSEANTPDEVIDAWGKIKAAEKTISERKSLLDGVPRSLPALSRAQKLTKRAAKVDFDWTTPERVLPKVREEAEEFVEAVESGDTAHAREELGDLLFVIVNAARSLNTDAESALAEACDKFERRFRSVEAGLSARNLTLPDAAREEVIRLWNEAKRDEQS